MMLGSGRVKFQPKWLSKTHSRSHAQKLRLEGCGLPTGQIARGHLFAVVH